MLFGEKCWSLYWLQGWVHSYETLWYHGLMGVNWRLEFASYPSPLKWSFTQKKGHSEVPLDKACRFLEKFGHQPTVFEISSHLEMNVGYFLGDTWLDGLFFLIMQSTVSILYGRALIMIIYFGRVCLGFFDWDTYPGSQAQLQVCLSNVSTFPCKAVCCLDLSMSWPSLVVGVGWFWKHKGLNPSRNLNKWILGIGENPGTRLNAKLACKSCNWIVMYTQRCDHFFWHWLSKKGIDSPDMSPDDLRVCFSTNRVPLMFMVDLQLSKYVSQLIWGVDPHFQRQMLRRSGWNLGARTGQWCGLQGLGHQHSHHVYLGVSESGVGDMWMIHDDPIISIFYRNFRVVVSCCTHEIPVYWGLTK